jgi:hypothetical protein
MSKGVGNSPGNPPSSANIRKPTDASPLNGVVYNPPRYAEWGGLVGPSKTVTTVNNSAFDVGNPLTISKPNGGRG